MAPAPVPTDALEAVLDPNGSGCMLPVEAYTDSGVLDWERRHFFDGSWVCAGRSADLAESGMRRGVQLGDRRLLLVRDGTGRLRAYANVCRHRGHELQPCGATAKRGAIHCPYHAWTYSLDGALTNTPRFDAPDDFDAAQFGLSEYRVEEWCGWAMVNVSGDAPPLGDHVGAFDEMLAPWNPGRLVVGATHEYVSPCNWKLPIENYHECYHCPAIHPELCMVSAPESGDNYHAGGLWIGGTMILNEHAETMSFDGSSQGVTLPGLDDEHRRQVLYIGLFPNMLISAHPDYVMTHRIEPRAPGETWVECQWLFDPDAVARPDFDPAYAVDFWDLTNRQDWAACEGVQRGLESGGYQPGPFSLAEDAVRDWVRLIAGSYLAGSVVPV